MTHDGRHVLVVANETVAGRRLIDAVRARAEADDEALVTVICPISNPREGYVVYEDTRRAAAGRRLDKTLRALRESGVPAQGFVVESDPDEAVRDALAQLEPPVTEIVVSTHPVQRSGWLRKNVVDRIRSAAGDRPVEHVVAESGEDEQKNVLVLANETVVGDPLLGRIRDRAGRGPASFLIICPQDDPSARQHPDAERRLRRALSILRAEGIEVHGQVAHPDAFTAAKHAVRDERIDEIIVSTFEAERSGWLRKDLVRRLRDETELPVEHVTLARDEVPA